MSEELEINTEFARALDIINNSDHHLFITGKAGTGKSTLLQALSQGFGHHCPDGCCRLKCQRANDSPFFQFPD